jgi:adenylate kinase family enzyme
MIICGPSRSGKSTFSANLIKNSNTLIGGKTKFSNILWCYKSKNSIPDQLKNDNMIQFIQGVPDVNDIMPNTLIVFDDLMMDAFSKDVAEIFTVPVIIIIYQ